MSQNQLTEPDRAELIRLGQLATGTVRHDLKTGKNVVVPNKDYQLPKHLRNTNGRPAQH